MRGNDPKAWNLVMEHMFTEKWKEGSIYGLAFLERVASSNQQP